LTFPLRPLTLRLVKRFGVHRPALVAVFGVLALAGSGLALGGGSSSDLAVAYQVNPAHNGFQADGALAPPLAQRWVATFANPTSYPLIADGKVFVTVSTYPSYGSTLYALDQADGHVLWSQPIPGTFFFSAAAYDAGRVFVLNYDGTLRAFDSGSGAFLWSAQLPGQSSFTSPPTAANGYVYVGGAGSGGTLYTVSEAAQGVLTTQPVMNGDDSSPAVSSGGVFVSYACNQAYGFSLIKLSPLWHDTAGCEGGGGKTVVYANGRVYTRDFFGDLILDAATGTQLGTYSSSTAPAADATTLFTLTSGTLTAQSIADGSTSWTFTGDGQLDSAPIVVATGNTSEYVVEGSSSGNLYALDAATGNVVWSTNAGAPIAAPDEQNAVQLTGLAAGQGLLVVPAGNTVVAYAAADTTAPTITVPPTITVRTASSSGTAVSYNVTVSDPDDAATVSCAPASGSTFLVGTTTVNCAAHDTHGNTSTASFSVVVVLDTTAPTITVPGPIAVKGMSPSGAVVTYTVTASDPDDAAAVTCAPASGSTFPIGPTTVSCTAKDTVGNTSTASFLVAVSSPNADCRLSDYAAKGALNLKNANLSGCYLAGANLSNANATSANMAGTVLTNANLAGAKLNFANLTGARLAGATLTGISWTQATCPDGTNASANGGTCVGHLG
jgi:outer membrane protein assembly factor BamB